MFVMVFVQVPRRRSKDDPEGDAKAVARVAEEQFLMAASMVSEICERQLEDHAATERRIPEKHSVGTPSSAVTQWPVTASSTTGPAM
ncbi:MAG: hypothetical protein ACRENE_03095 [Polyangiaceae bacterium]